MVYKSAPFRPIIPRFHQIYVIFSCFTSVTSQSVRTHYFIALDHPAVEGACGSGKKEEYAIFQCKFAIEINFKHCPFE